jgi:hypothetical protein
MTKATLINQIKQEQENKIIYIAKKIQISTGCCYADFRDDGPKSLDKTRNSSSETLQHHGSFFINLRYYVTTSNGVLCLKYFRHTTQGERF